MVTKNTYKNGDREYYIPELNKNFPSVTTVIGLLDKSGPLMGWAIKCMRQYAGKKFYQAVEERTPLCYELVDMILDEAASNYRKISGEALDIGSQVHNLIEVYLHGQRVDGLIEANPLLKKPFLAFLEWKNAHRFEMVASEQIIWSERGYAGTLDCVGTINGKLCVIDFKTSKAIYDEYWMQVAAYVKAYEERSGNGIQGAGILRICKDESGNHEWQEIGLEELEAHYEAFTHLLNFWWSRKDRKNAKRTQFANVS